MAGIVILWLLLLGDFVTTSYAMSVVEVNKPDGTLSLSEGNPLMTGLVNDPAQFLLSKFFVLALVIGAAYILRGNGKMAYMPYLIVGGMYLFAVLNNVSLLLPVL